MHYPGELLRKNACLLNTCGAHKADYVFLAEMEFLHQVVCQIRFDRCADTHLDQLIKAKTRRTLF